MPDRPNRLNAPENTPVLTGRELLRRAGFEPAVSAVVDDLQVRGRLWELIYAMAARRFFLRATNHLSDRELYHWLHDEWLAKSAVEVPSEAGWNPAIELAGWGTPAATDLYLRFYADEHVRARWAARFPEAPLPSREAPAFDRDRFLPAALEPAAESEGSVPLHCDFVERDDDPGEPPFDTLETGDPLGLKSVDREIRREQRKLISDDAAVASLLPEEQPLFERVAKIDQDGWQRPHEELARSGVVLLPPDELTDETVGPKLWELLHELACRGFYVLNTDHLSDREVYSNLWREDLREPAILPGRSRHGGWFHDCVGSGSEEHTLAWLRFFASDEARARHALESPRTPLPTRESPRFKRDWRLPKGPF